MGDYLEFSPTDNSLITFDGRIIHIFSDSHEAWLIPRQGLTGIKVMTGFGRSMLFENRLGTSYGVDYDKDRYDEVVEFAQRLEESELGID